MCYQLMQGLAVLAVAGALVAAVTLGIAKNPADTLQVGAQGGTTRCCCCCCSSSSHGTAASAAANPSSAALYNLLSLPGSLQGLASSGSTDSLTTIADRLSASL